MQKLNTSKNFLAVAIRSALRNNSGPLLAGFLATTTATPAFAFNQTLDLTTLVNDSSKGFVVNGRNAGDKAGAVVSVAGDINGDGDSDFFIGASGANSKNGEAYVVFGGSNVTGG